MKCSVKENCHLYYMLIPLVSWKLVKRCFSKLAYPLLGMLVNSRPTRIITYPGLYWSEKKLSM